MVSTLSRHIDQHVTRGMQLMEEHQHLNVADKTREATRTIEGKATTLAGFAATLIGLSIAQNRLDLESLKWLLIASDILLFVSICLAIWANTLRQASLPSAVIYNLPRALKKENEGYIASALAESWYEYTRDLALFQGKKAVAVRLQFTAFLIGILLLTGSSVYAIARPPIQKQTKPAMNHRFSIPTSLQPSHSRVQHS